MAGRYGAKHDHQPPVRSVPGKMAVAGQGQWQLAWLGPGLAVVVADGEEGVQLPVLLPDQQEQLPSVRRTNRGRFGSAGTTTATPRRIRVVLRLMRAGYAPVVASRLFRGELPVLTDTPAEGSAAATLRRSTRLPHHPGPAHPEPKASPRLREAA